MAQRAFDVEAVVPVDPEAAIEFLTDLTRHRGLHPYLVDAVVTEKGEDGSGPWATWRVRERPRLGPFRYSIRFDARLTRTSPTSFSSWVLAAPGCTIDATTSARNGETPGTAHLVEHAVVTAPAPLLAYMAHHAELAHARTFDRLPDVLSGRSDR